MSIKWTSHETMKLLQLYLKHKDDFRGQFNRNSKIWTLVAGELQKQGISTNYIRADRKFRNLKRTFKNIKKQNIGKSNWHYLGIMEKIFEGSCNNSVDLITSDEEETVCEPKIEFLSEPYDKCEEEFLDESNFEEIISDRKYNEEEDVDVDSPYLNLAEELEAQRLEELRLIRLSLQEANLIQKERNQILQERNELMKQFLEAKNKTNNRV